MTSTHVKKKNPPRRHPFSLSNTRIPQFPLNNLMKDAMSNIPNAIQNLPNFMQRLISNHASFVGSGRSFTDDIMLADISEYDEEDNNEEDEQKLDSTEQKSNE